MRARYDDPNVGRFISEHPQCRGENWFCNARCNPVNFSDATGCEEIRYVPAFTIFASAGAACTIYVIANANKAPEMAMMAACWAAVWNGAAMDFDTLAGTSFSILNSVWSTFLITNAKFVLLLLQCSQQNQNDPILQAKVAVIAWLTYSLMVLCAADSINWWGNLYFFAIM
jgi:hypothetical protein